ncbi:MAG: haloacid dehalogenase type II [Bacteroidota bacterium]
MKIDSTVKALVFDAYGTLFDVASISVGNISNQITKEVEVVWRTNQLNYSWLYTIMEKYQPFSEITKDALVYASKKFGIELSASELEKVLTVYNQIEAYEDVSAMLHQYKKLYRLNILTNADPLLIENALKYNELTHYFHTVYSANEVRKFKPNASVYNLVLEGLGLSAREVLFFSSNAWDIFGAGTFGFQTCWVNRQQQPFYEVPYQPNYIIQSFTAQID